MTEQERNVWYAARDFIGQNCPELLDTYTWKLYVNWLAGKDELGEDLPASDPRFDPNLTDQQNASRFINDEVLMPIS